MRLVSQFENLDEDISADVFCDTSTDEYIVEFFQGCVHLEIKDFYTSSYADARRKALQYVEPS